MLVMYKLGIVQYGAMKYHALSSYRNYNIPLQYSTSSVSLPDLID